MALIDERFDLELLRGAKRYQHWLISAFGPAVSGEVLEVGAGTGNFTRWLSKTATSVVVAEPDPVMCKDVVSLGLPNVQVLCTPLEALDGGEPVFDCVFLCNVLEHILDDDLVLKVALSLLQPGGHACVVVPAHQALFGSLDLRYGHLRRYRREQVRSDLEQAGFEGIAAQYFNPLGALGWFLVAKVARRPRLSRGSVTLSEWLAVPVGRALQRVGPPPFGQSVVATGRRPALTGEG